VALERTCGCIWATVLEQAGAGRQSSIFGDELVAAALPRIYTPHETSGDVCAIEP